MRKKALWSVVVVSMFSSLLFLGCASTHKSLYFKDSELSKQPVRIARYVDQEYRVIHSAGRNTAAWISAVTLVGGIATKEGVKAWERSLAKEINDAGMPKINELVMNTFVARAASEIPGWPPMVIEEQAVSNKKDYFRQYSGTKMLFVNATNYAPHLSTRRGFVSYFYGFLVDSEGDVFWEKMFVYTSSGFGRERSVEEYKADNFKFFKEEIKFAAGTIVSAFIEDIKKRVKTPQVFAQPEGEQGALITEDLSQEQTQPQEEPRDFGIISITSEPPGAKVFIDGEYKGQTPVEMLLATGTYQLFLEHQLYEPYTDSLTIEQDQMETLNIRLSPEGKEQK
jgi:hypothetical protein